MRVYGVVMAGGSGTRFWPISRQHRPKQLLNLTGKDAMINEAVARLKPVCKDGIFIVSSKSQRECLLEVLDKDFPKDHILLEPAARNTAACIGYAAIEIVKRCGDGVLAVIPSDSYIKNTEAFLSALTLAVKTAEEKDAIVTVCIKPTFPATGYGYIRYEDVPSPVKPVRQFVEKPDLARAEEYLKSGEFVWNSGMFIWKASLILQKLEKYLPELYQELLRIGEAVGTEREEAVIDSVYPEMPSISVDYGVLEKSDGIYVVPADLGWSDVGSLDMLGAVRRADENDNVTVGETYPVDTHHTIIYTGGKPVCTVGVDDLIIVDTPDVLLVCSKERAQDVKKIVEELRAKGKEELL